MLLDSLVQLFLELSLCLKVKHRNDDIHLLLVLDVLLGVDRLEVFLRIALAHFDELLQLFHHLLILFVVVVVVHREGSLGHVEQDLRQLILLLDVQVPLALLPEQVVPQVDRVVLPQVIDDRILIEGCRLLHDVVVVVLEIDEIWLLRRVLRGLGDYLRTQLFLVRWNLRVKVLVIS